MNTDLIYPIYETEEDSWERFLKIYELTDQIAGEDCIVPVDSNDIRDAWAGIAMYWKIAAFFGNNADFMYEAIYHIRYGRFSQNVNTHNELLLTLLIEDELCRCGYAFHVCFTVTLPGKPFDIVGRLDKGSICGQLRRNIFNLITLGKTFAYRAGFGVTTLSFTKASNESRQLIN